MSPMTFGAVTEDELDELRDVVIGQTNLPGHATIVRLLATIDALRDKLGRSFQCKHGRVLSSCIGCDTEAEAEIADLRIDLARATADGGRLEARVAHLEAALREIAASPLRCAETNIARAALEGR